MTLVIGAVPAARVVVAHARCDVNRNDMRSRAASKALLRRDRQTSPVLRATKRTSRLRSRRPCRAAKRIRSGG